MAEKEETIPEDPASKPIEPDVGRLALIVAELQAELMSLGKQLGMTLHQIQVIDQAAAQRLQVLESAVGIARVPNTPNIPPKQPSTPPQ